MPSRSLMMLRLLVLTLACCFAPSLHAGVALTKNVEGDAYTLRITGEISESMLAEFLQVLNSVQSSQKKIHLNMVHLNSQGGSDSVAMELGRKIRRLGLNTFVFHDGICNSACVYIFIGGINRYSFGKFGVHRTTFEDGTEPNRRLTPDIVDRNILKIHDYIRELRISSNLVTAILDTPPWSVRYLTSTEMYDWGINGTDRPEADVQLLEIAKERNLKREQVFKLVDLHFKDCHRQTIHLKQTLWDCLRNRNLDETLWARFKMWISSAF